MTAVGAQLAFWARPGSHRQQQTLRVCGLCQKAMPECAARELGSPVSEARPVKSLRRCPAQSVCAVRGNQRCQDFLKAGRRKASRRPEIQKLPPPASLQTSWAGEQVTEGGAAGRGGGTERCRFLRSGARRCQEERLQGLRQSLQRGSSPAGPRASGRHSCGEATRTLRLGLLLETERPGGAALPPRPPAGLAGGATPPRTHCPGSTWAFGLII